MHYVQINLPEEEVEVLVLYGVLKLEILIIKVVMVVMQSIEMNHHQQHKLGLKVVNIIEGVLLVMHNIVVLELLVENIMVEIMQMFIVVLEELDGLEELVVMMLIKLDKQVEVDHHIGDMNMLHLFNILVVLLVN